MWEIKNLYEKLNNLPEPTRSYAMSLKGASINSDIFSLANVESDKWASITLLISGIIVKEVELNGLENKIKDFLGIGADQALSLAIEVAGARLLIFDDWLGGEVEKYLKSHGVDLSRYAALIAEQQLAIAKEKEYFQEQLSDDEIVEEEGEVSDDFKDVLADDTIDTLDLDLSKEEREADIESRKKDLLKTLSGDFLKILKSNNLDELYEFNYSFVLVWIEDEFFHTAVSPALLSNQEKIASANLIDTDEEKPATISSLLRAFIKVYGLSANDLNIAEFLSSKAVSLFSDAEKVLALRILKFNNNISNLDSYLEADFQNVPEGFEVLSPPATSLKKERKEVTRHKRETSNEKEKRQEALTKTSSPKKVETKAGPSFKKPDTLEVDKTREEVKKTVTVSSTLVEELEKILQDYAPGSLEHKTISQEIKRLDASKKK